MTMAEPIEDGEGRSIASPRAAETLHLLMRLRARGVGDTLVLRAFEAVPRSFFSPAAYRDLAGRDVALPTGCGQTVGAPSDLALALAALELRKEHHALDIGTGSGYAAAVMGQLAGAVISIERFRTLAIEAERRLEGCGVANVRVVQGDALDEVPAAGPFHRAFIDFAVPEPPPAVARRLVDGAICVFARPDERMCHLVRAEKLAGGGWREKLIGLTRVAPPIAGMSRYL
ncbi:protein-L-isoaspartate(D-aspartate) O-methyltransferase [Rhizobiales bacterium GAS113]|nr:protein-L-isoaspartate(D-aspartate) O-methyltransferase [Rhizobiales bacterium GAS113]